MTAPAFTVRTVGKPKPTHETLRLFVDGASAGLVTMSVTEAAAFRALLAPDGGRSLADERHADRVADGGEAIGGMLDAQGKV